MLQGGGLMATLSYLDFFQTGVQRVAVSTAALMCRSIPHSSHPVLVDAVPLLTPLLQNSVQPFASVLTGKVVTIWLLLRQQPGHPLSAETLQNCAKHVSYACFHPVLVDAVHLITSHRAECGKMRQNSVWL